MLVGVGVATFVLCKSTSSGRDSKQCHATTDRPPTPDDEQTRAPGTNGPRPVNPGVRTAAPVIRSAARSARTRPASASGRTATAGRTPREAASRRNSSPSARVLAVTLRSCLSETTRRHSRGGECRTGGCRPRRASHRRRGHASPPGPAHLPGRTASQRPAVRRGSVGGPAGDTPSTIPNRAPSWCQREMVTLRAFVCAAWAKVS